MSDFLPNHYISYDVLKHKTLPIFLTAEFDFYRCVPFNDMFYGKTVSELHQGNLRSRQSWNRYSMLFSGKKVSYWADSKKLPMLKCKNMDKDIIYLLSLLMMTQRQVFQLSQKTETFCG